jgi:hypothetical protein
MPAVKHKQKQTNITIIVITFRIICILKYVKCIKFASYLNWWPAGNSTYQLETQNEPLSFIKKNSTRCNNVSKFYYSIFIWSSTCFGRHAAHHQEPKTALAASGFSNVEGCWTCSWWTLSGTLCLTTSTSYTSDNLPRMKNQRLPVQF